ncbi:hypothetical protein C1878_08730 [Gordonibacter sp. 28C]|uniref:hypothetical protein n=1 Tax=Gordonibacter sp. 28C TaxID=2078569 RepID=UPI000DF79135|nr:hypothetical protein [Gordonibacter sp. 28C]RDB62392.1 hypothetical protein C1878_08730 [Gordonibacter sp. 28C]
MDGITIMALVTAALALVALALIALMFWRGSWLFLVAGRAAEDEAEDAAEGRRLLARRMAVVLLIGCALVATLILFEGFKLAGNASLAWAATMANNVAFVALLVGMVWFFVVQRPDRSKDDAAKEESRMAARARSARLDHLPMATLVFTIAFIAVIALVGVLFAGL